mmetsp:Transcript_49487/g.105803  ORF Transcript_49487/g.105803 Transcript_49487/m.105803 type:complete len:136 (-) Transcript_49487:125-532(-)
MDLELRVSSLSGVLHEVSASRDWAVICLKMAVRAEIPVCDKRLFHGTRELKNSERLSCCFEEGVITAELTLVVRPHGEAEQERRARVADLRSRRVARRQRNRRERMRRALDGDDDAVHAASDGHDGASSGAGGAR